MDKVTKKLLYLLINHLVLFMLVSLMLFPIISTADTTKFGIGSGLLFGELDLIVSYQPDDDHWVFGYRHGYDESEDEGFCGVCKTREETTMIGPFVDYIFYPEKTSSFYSSIGLFDVKLTLIAVDINEIDSDSITALFIGGGYTGWYNKTIFYDVGLVFNMGDDLSVETSVKSTETTSLGGRIILGVSF